MRPAHRQLPDYHRSVISDRRIPGTQYYFPFVLRGRPAFVPARLRPGAPGERRGLAVEPFRRSLRPSTVLRALGFDRAHRPSFDPPVESLWVEREALDGERVEGRLSTGNPQSEIRNRSRPRLRSWDSCSIHTGRRGFHPIPPQTCWRQEGSWSLPADPPQRRAPRPERGPTPTGTSGAAKRDDARAAPAPPPSRRARPACPVGVGAGIEGFQVPSERHGGLSSSRHSDFGPATGR
jgi:hypothetical protein